MEALDGNAIAGPLCEQFGVEMTAAGGECSSCGAPALIAQLVVYLRAPGTVVRCPSCGSVVIVIVEIRGVTSVRMDGFRLDDPPGDGRPRG
jgi:DNA-directed RNA polymerase subunit RPC12/RpoP